MSDCLKCLTPIYGITVLANDGHPENFPLVRKEIRYSKGYYFEWVQKPLTEKNAIKLIEQLEREGKAARAYHYGFKQRGFRPTDKNIGEICRTTKWPWPLKKSE